MAPMMNAPFALGRHTSKVAHPWSAMLGFLFALLHPPAFPARNTEYGKCTQHFLALGRLKAEASG